MKSTLPKIAERPASLPPQGGNRDHGMIKLSLHIYNHVFGPGLRKMDKYFYPIIDFWYLSQCHYSPSLPLEVIWREEHPIGGWGKRAAVEGYHVGAGDGMRGNGCGGVYLYYSHLGDVYISCHTGRRMNIIQSILANKKWLLHGRTVAGFTQML